MKGLAIIALAAGATTLAGAALLSPGVGSASEAYSPATIWPETRHEFVDDRLTDRTGEAEGHIESVTRNADGSLHSMQVVWTGPAGMPLGLVDHPARFLTFHPDQDLVVAQIGWPELAAGYRDALAALTDDAEAPGNRAAASNLIGTS